MDVVWFSRTSFALWGLVTLGASLSLSSEWSLSGAAHLQTARESVSGTGVPRALVPPSGLSTVVISVLCLVCSLQLPILLFLALVRSGLGTIGCAWLSQAARFSRRGSGDPLEVVFKCSLCQSVRSPVVS